MSILEKAQNCQIELRKYGVYEVFLHIKNRINPNEKDETLILIEKEKYLIGLNEEEFALELKAFCEKIMKVKLDYSNPKTFTEKIQYMMAHDSESDRKVKQELSDKYAVRKWVSDRIGEEYLVPLLGVWDNVEEIDFDKLPSRFVLKTNHGSGMNIVVKNKDEIDKKVILYRLEWWLKRPFWVTSLEKQYINIPRKIIAEEYLEDNTGGLADYKIHCFHGEPKFIQYITDRNANEHTATNVHMDFNWNNLGWTFGKFKVNNSIIMKPQNISELYDIARRLSTGFPYVRVDLYDIDSKVYFSEMTFTPAGGLYQYKGTWTPSRDLELGDMIRL